MTTIYGHWPKPTDNRPAPTIEVRTDQYGAVHLTLPGGIHVSVSEDEVRALAEQLIAAGRKALAAAGEPDDILRDLAVLIVAEQQYLARSLVARVHGAVENYLTNPPTAEERTLLLALGIEVDG
jgi:hypothetical protein